MTDTDIPINKALTERIRRKKEFLDSKRPLGKDALDKLREEFRLVHTYNSNAIEGNTLTLQETRLVLEEGITIGGKTLAEHLEATGTAQGYDYIEKIARDKEDISHVTVQTVHEIVMRGLLAEPGKYRTENVRITGAIKSPPDYSKVPRQMDELFRAMNSMRTEPLTAAAYFHHRFVEIHPFVNGNGRVARLLTNLLLVRNGYPPVVIRRVDRKRYYAALRMADGGDIKPFVQLIAKAVDESLTLYISVFGGDDELVPLSELAKNSPYSQEYLSLRARQGVIDAIKMGKAWHSTKRAVDEYVKEHGGK